MGKYLYEVSYTQDGVKGVRKEGGSSRVTTIEKLVKAHGGKVEAFYFAFGGADAYLIVDLPSSVEAAAISLAVSASGAATLKTIVLLTPAEVDSAAKVEVDYRAPGR
jgi:uncharacterized protein with GYD domain